MANELAGEIALVTGANRGIGKQISVDLAAAGATVILSAREVASLSDVQRQIDSAGGQFESVSLDVTQEQMVTDTVDGIISRLPLERRSPGFASEQCWHWRWVPISLGPAC